MADTPLRSFGILDDVWNAAQERASVKEEILMDMMKRAITELAKQGNP